MRYVIAVLALLAGVSVKAQPSVDVLEYISAYKQLAMLEMQRSGVPASITLAQGIHETYAGKSELVLKSNNHFGIKCKSNWAGGKVYHDDDERGECFRQYGNPAESYKDHSDFLRNSQRYAFLFTLDPTDYKAWAYGLKKAGYATNIKYSNILIRLIEQYNLQQYTLIAMGKLQPEDELLARNSPPVEVAASTDTKVEPVAEVLEQAEVAPVTYPSGEFLINNTRVVFVKAGTSLLSIAEEYGVSYSRLLEFNDLKDANVAPKDQLLFLQRKRKTGANEFHTVLKGETLYDIAQVEAIRLESLASLNHLNIGMQPAPGQVLSLQKQAAARPVLVSEQVSNVLSTSVESAALTPKSTHIVQTKETLYSIARKYGVEVEQIREWNKLPGFDLRIGQELVILKN